MKCICHGFPSFLFPLIKSSYYQLPFLEGEGRHAKCIKRTYKTKISKTLDLNVLEIFIVIRAGFKPATF